VVAARPAPEDVAGGLVPRLGDTSALPLAIGILGATVMPHVIYLHSALTQRRVQVSTVAQSRFVLRHQRLDIVVAMGLAGVVNAGMLVTAAALRHRGPAGGSPGGVGLDGVHDALAVHLGPVCALLFGLALLASGFASSGVGTMAGQVVMAGFLRRRVPLVVRRLVTLVPALVVLGSGMEPSRALVLSQVVLSFGIPFALLPLLLLGRRRDLMGPLVNRRPTTLLMAAVTAAVSALNGWLVMTTLTGT
jgi:manganese transport protein